MGTLSESELHLLDAYWRAATYQSVGQIYLFDNPLLKDRRASACDTSAATPSAGRTAPTASRRRSRG
jgi:phosphoketolase